MPTSSLKDVALIVTDQLALRDRNVDDVVGKLNVVFVAGRQVPGMIEAAALLEGTEGKDRLATPCRDRMPALETLGYQSLAGGLDNPRIRWGTLGRAKGRVLPSGGDGAESARARWQSSCACCFPRF